MVEVERQTSPIKAFTADCLVISTDSDVMTPKDSVYELYVMWCTSEGFMPKGKSVFFRDLLAAYPGQLEVGRHRVDGKQVQMLRGARVGSED